MHAEENKNKTNFRFKQLQKLEQEIPWNNLVELISSHYHTSNICHRQVAVESMIRIYFLQLRYSMSASAIEGVLFQIEILRDFVLIDIETDVIPNASCIDSFHSLIFVNGMESEFKDTFNMKSIMAGN
jgi:IS5 family transposase